MGAGKDSLDFDHADPAAAAGAACGVGASVDAAVASADLAVWAMGCETDRALTRLLMLLLLHLLLSYQLLV